MIERLTLAAPSWIESELSDIAALSGYLEALLLALTVPAAGDDVAIDAAALPERVFETLTSREFCAVNKKDVASYRDGVVGSVRRALRRAEPIRFYYDIGGGYHTTIQLGGDERSFDPGLAELLMLKQVVDFAGRVRRYYPLGVTFALVVANLRAYLVDDVPVERTLGYCRNLRRLIRDVGLDPLVDVITESEHFSVADFAGLRGDGIDRAGQILDASEHLLAPMIRGVHLSQRASREALGFRPFAGADSAIDGGEVALTRNSRQALGPVLLTSANYVDYAVRRHRFPDVLPSAITHVTYAERIAPHRR